MRGVVLMMVCAALLALAGRPVHAQVSVQSLMEPGTGKAAPAPAQKPRRDIVLQGGQATSDQVLDLKPGVQQDQYPLNLGVSADVKLERGMAAVGYAFARLDPETAAKIYRLHLGENNENLGSRFVWLGERGSAMHATLFMVDSATTINAEGTDQIHQPNYMDMSVETQRLLSDRVRVEAGLSKALFLRNPDAGQFNGFTTDVNQGMTVQAGLGYVPLNNISLNLESVYRAPSTPAAGDKGRAINLSGNWAAKDSVLLGAAFVHYDQDTTADGTAPTYFGAPVDGQTIQFQAFIDLDSANNLVLGVKALQHGRSYAPFGYSGLQNSVNSDTIFEVSISSDF